MEKIHEEIRKTALALHSIATNLKTLLPTELPYQDIIASLPTNAKPDQKYMVARKWIWWPLRHPDDVTGITIHHTMSHSPQATASYCTRPTTQQGKGYPSIQYHFWVSAGDGCPVYLCAPVTWGVWHDNTGAHQKTISVGMAGHLHTTRPPDEQLQAATRLVHYLMDLYHIPVTEVQGHNDRMWAAMRRRTTCPGWDVKASGNWRQDFFEVLGRL